MPADVAVVISAVVAAFVLFAAVLAWAHTGKARLEAASADAAERVKLRRFISMVLQ